MTQPDPFAFVLEALGVGVAHQDEGPRGAGYYLQAPEPEWLGASYTVALKAARELVNGSKPALATDWLGLARQGVSLLNMFLGPDESPPASVASWDDDDLPDDEA